MDYFKKQLELLAVERAADQAAYLKLSQSSSAVARRSSGITWYPIAIRGTEPSRGDYITVEVERTTHTEAPHRLRFGASATLFSNYNPEHDFVAGTIAYVGGNRLKITLRTDELPDWASDGKLGIDLLFDEASYEEMQRALKAAATFSENAAEGRLTRTLIGAQKPTFNLQLPALPHPTLNNSQQAAVNKILSANELAIVHGPPGTGKTTTLVAAIKAIIKQQGGPVLVTAPSNTAVDLLSEKLANEGLNVLRVGNPTRVSERLNSLTMDSQISMHPAMKEAKKLKKQAAEFKNMAHKYKRNFGKAEREQRKALFDEAHRIMKEVGNTEQYIINDLIGKASVIAATLVGSNHFSIRHVNYHTAVIDEAGQALEPACWIPAIKAQKLVLAGDHQQLPPTIKSIDAAKGGLSKTLLEKCVALHPEAVSLLEEQYRMHEKIMGYSSQVFYGAALKAHPSVASHLLFEGDEPLYFIDTAGCGFEEKSEGNSTTNPEEAAFLLQHLGSFATQLLSQYTVEDFPTIAIISPYKQQVEILKEGLLHTSSLGEIKNKISINTVDGFQGQERDIVYLSMTRSNTDGVIGFLADTRRMNVAMTRARKKLVAIGDSATLSTLPFYEDFIAYTQACNSYKSAWEFMDA